MIQVRITHFYHFQHHIFYLDYITVVLHFKIQIYVFVKLINFINIKFYENKNTI